MAWPRTQLCNNLQREAGPDSSKKCSNVAIEADPRGRELETATQSLQDGTVES